MAISARTGYGFEELLQKIARLLPQTQRRMKLLIPYDKGNLLSEIREEGKIFSEEYTPEGTLVDALVEMKLLHKVEGMVKRD